MANIGSLTHPPIKEALISVTFAESQNLNLANLENFCDTLKNTYPLKEKILSQEIMFQIGVGGKDFQRKDTSIGFKISSEDGKYIAQITLNGMTLSRLEPYVDGDELITEYEKLWQSYSQAFQVEPIKRIGLRYINFFSVPTSIVDSFLQIKPMLVVERTQPLYFANVFCNYLVHSPQHACNAAIGFSLQGVDNDKANVTFDIDTFQDLDRQYKKFEDLRPYLNKFRTFKNYIFFDNITQTAVDYFNDKHPI